MREGQVTWATACMTQMTICAGRHPDPDAVVQTQAGGRMKTLHLKAAGKLMLGP